MYFYGQIHVWLILHKGDAPIPEGWEVLVQKAIQGHPESAILWEIHINGIVIHIGFKPTTHESCLYVGYFDGVQLYFNTVASTDTTLNQKVIQLIKIKMTIQVKDLGLIHCFNGVDVKQTKYSIKINVNTHLHKKIKGQSWLKVYVPLAQPPLPMDFDSTYVHQLEQAGLAAPMESKVLLRLEKEMRFTYQQIIGESIWP
jgi:hypothetical protein